jgi:hypothetical protein
VTWTWEHGALRLRAGSTDVFFCAPSSLPHDHRDLTAERVGNPEALRWLDDTWRDNVREFRRFARQLDLADAQSWTRWQDHQVRAAIAQQIERGRLTVLVRRSSRTAVVSNQALDQQLQVVRTLRRVVPGPLRLDGLTYELVVGASLGARPVADTVQVVPQDDASAILDKMIAASSASTPARDALTQARPLLSPDWRRPAPPNGLVLLQTRVTRQTGVSGDGPAMTPAAFKAALMPTTPPTPTPSALPKLAPPRLSDLLPQVDLSFSAGAALTDDGPEDTPAPEPLLEPTSDQAASADLVPIEIDLFAATGEPLPGIPYTITLPDGTSRSGHADENGFIRIPENTQTGDLKLTLDDFEDQKAS